MTNDSIVKETFFLNNEIRKIKTREEIDVIIFSENEKEHVSHIDWVLKKLNQANMTTSQSKVSNTSAS